MLEVFTGLGLMVFKLNLYSYSFEIFKLFYFERLVQFWVNHKLNTCIAIGWFWYSFRLGGFLFQIGGFTLPFFVMGGLQFFIFIIAFFTFPDIESTNTNRTESTRMLPLLKIPRFLVTILVAFVSSLSIGFLQPSLELHLAPVRIYIQIQFFQIFY